MMTTFRAWAATAVGALALGALTSPAHAGAPVTAEVAATFVQRAPIAVPPIPFAKGVMMSPDLVYADVKGYRPLTLDLYVPPGGGKRPLIIEMHGGGWSQGTSRDMAAFENFPNVLADLASRGYVVAAVNYRLSGEAPFPAQAQDIDAAIRWLKAHADVYGIDPARTASWGDSAGGHLAAMTALDCDSSATNNDCVSAAVAWYGVFDMTPPPGLKIVDAQWATTYAFLGCKVLECPDKVRAASPISHVTAKAPPMLLLHGDKDWAVPHTQAEAMVKALQAVGAPVRYQLYPGASHGWFGATPDQTRAFHIKALQDTFDFFDETLKPH